MNKKHWQILILSLIAIVLVGVYLYTYKNEAPEDSATSNATQTQATSRAQEETDAYSLNVQYPTFDESLSGAKLANETIKQNLNLRIAQFKKDADETAKAPTDLPKDIKSTLDGSASVEYETDRFVSMYFGAEWYMRGAAHGTHTIDTYIFDKKLGKVVDITDLFISGSGYLQFLSTYAKADLIAQSKEGDLGLTFNEQMLNAGTEGIFDNFRLMLPTKDGLVVYFTEYQVAPYAAGSQQVVVPYDKLKPYINPDGALSVYLN